VHKNTVIKHFHTLKIILAKINIFSYSIWKLLKYCWTVRWNI